MNKEQIFVGNKVRFYNYTTCQNDVGFVTALDVPIRWKLFRITPIMGVEINGSLTREYCDIEKVSENLPSSYPSE